MKHKFHMQLYSAIIILRKTGILFACGLIFCSCDRTSRMRGYDFIPDMVYSRAYDTYSNNPNFHDSMTMRSPVAGTVPIGFIPFRYTIDSISRDRAGKELKNPFRPDDEILTAGKNIFTTFCIGCHGATGKGDGRLFTSGLYPLKPRDISAKPTADLMDGQIYHTITLGFGSMGAHGAQIKPDDRWKTVIYVRELQRMARDSANSVRWSKNKPNNSLLILN